jgi:xanthine dehydrogenase accessory factor
MTSGRTIDGWDVIDRAQELARDGQEFALATVVWRQGPSSGQQGSRAIITAGGDLHGWIGGACAEPVVIREAREVIRSREPRLLLLGAAERFGAAIPDGMAAIPISCQSEGALEVYIEPVVPTPHLVIVGRSPMAHTLADLATALGWRTDLWGGPEFASAHLDARSVVVVATQGHGDEEAVEHAVAAAPAYVGLVASKRRGEAIRGYLAERGTPGDRLDRVRAPVGLDLGHTSHREIAVAILAELVRLRAAGELLPGRSAGSAAGPVAGPVAEPAAGPAQAADPVCGMTVAAGDSAHRAEHEGVTYHFCRAGCRDAFIQDPGVYTTTGDAHAGHAHAGHAPQAMPTQATPTRREV